VDVNVRRRRGQQMTWQTLCLYNCRQSLSSAAKGGRHVIPGWRRNFQFSNQEMDHDIMIDLQRRVPHHTFEVLFELEQARPHLYRHTRFASRACHSGGGAWRRFSVR
jgi:hypothetical protein